MKKTITALLISAMSTSFVSAMDQSRLDELDLLYAQDKDKEGYALVEAALTRVTDAKEKSELLWRYSQFTHEMAKLSKREGIEKDAILAKFVEGADIATQAIEADADSAWAYYWRAANIGSWGSTNGIIDSLLKLDDMDDDLTSALAIDANHGDSWSVLAIIAADVPGLLGGSINRAVNLDRKAISVWQPGSAVPYEWYSELANHLYNRDWSAKKRASNSAKKSSKYQNESDMIEKAELFEGSIDFSIKALHTDKPLSELSDREEARQVFQWLIQELEKSVVEKPYLSKQVDRFKHRLATRDWS